MCTAVSFNNGYFGRNLDLERGYGERVVITPRHFEIEMRFEENLKSHYAMIGMAAVENGYPLYFEASNEKGLFAAGLNFPGNARYFEKTVNALNVSPFEFIPYLLGQCSSVSRAREILSRINLVNEDFSSELLLSPLHWMICDKNESIVVESTRDGLFVYDNPFGILTNNPPFDYHIINLSNYMSLSVGKARSQFDSSYPLENYSLGMGAIGLPGDFSSASRFVKAFFVKENSVCTGEECVNGFFHILDSVSMPRGCVWTGRGYEYTRYSCCFSAEESAYYYKTYNDFALQRVDMNSVDLDSNELFLLG